jgi:hypothetical protein
MYNLCISLKNKKGQKMISVKTNLILFIMAVTLSTTAVIAMEKELKEIYTMTIVNELPSRIFLNAKDPEFLTNQSPYAFVEGCSSKTFFLNSQKQKDNQTLALPGCVPPNKVKLPINKELTRFIIRKNNGKTIVEDNSYNLIAELTILNNAQ